GNVGSGTPGGRPPGGDSGDAHSLPGVPGAVVQPPKGRDAGATAPSGSRPDAHTGDARRGGVVPNGGHTARLLLPGGATGGGGASGAAGAGDDGGGGRLGNGGGSGGTAGLMARRYRRFGHRGGGGGRHLLRCAGVPGLASFLLGTVSREVALDPRGQLLDD